MSAKHLVREPRPLTVAKGRCFIDTNVLVYAHANDEPLKQAAQASRCNTLYSEDFQAGQVLRGVKVVNPFDALI